MDSEGPAPQQVLDLLHACLWSELGDPLTDYNTRHILGVGQGWGRRWGRRWGGQSACTISIAASISTHLNWEVGLCSMQSSDAASE